MTKRVCARVAVVVMALLGLAASASAQARLRLRTVAFVGDLCTSIESRGITWTFSTSHLCGQFATGDWWVVGPVSITDLDPKDTNGTAPHLHGSVINPAQSAGGPQGFDSRIETVGHGTTVTYSSTLNVADTALPLAVPAGSSLLSSESYGDESSTGPLYGRPAGSNTHWPFIKRIEILTVLASPPAAGSFRPPYVGTDKTIQPRWNTSFINYGALANHTPLASSPSVAATQTYAVEPQIEILTGFEGRYMHPAENYTPGSGGGSPTYGQFITLNYGWMLIFSNLNYTNAEKAPVVQRIIQIGIDIYGTAINATATSSGVIWANGGGHNQGRKLPMLFAGALLGDTNILARGDHANFKIFQEDGSHFYVSAGDVAITHTACCGRTVVQYVTGDIGTPEWGNEHIHQPVEDNAFWDASYRDITGSSTAGHILVAYWMGLEDEWNHPAIFDYFIDRLVPAQLPDAGSSNMIPVTVADLWVAYGPP